MPKGVHRVNYETIQNIIYGRLSISEAFNIPSPKTLAVTQILGPPVIQREPLTPNNEKMGTGRIRWSNLKTKKRKEPTKTPDQSALVASTKVIHSRGILDLARLPKQKSPKYISTMCDSLGTLTHSQGPGDRPLFYWSRHHPGFVHPKDSSQIAQLEM